MIYSRPWWFWAFAGPWGVLFFLVGVYVAFSAMFPPPEFDQMIWNRMVMFSFGAVIVGICAYGLPKSKKSIEIRDNEIIVNYITGKKEIFRGITRIEVKKEWQLILAGQAPTENIYVYHSTGKLVVYPFFFKDFRDLVKELEGVAGGIKNIEILKIGRK